jgi:hypothetical protein
MVYYLDLVLYFLLINIWNVIYFSDLIDHIVDNVDRTRDRLGNQKWL